METRPRFVRNMSDRICEKIIKQSKDNKTQWLESRVDEFAKDLDYQDLGSSRILVRRVLKNYKPGKIRKHPQEFANVPDPVWARFSNQARDMRVFQTELLAFYALTQGER